jgi:hypothetical protein
MPPSIEVGFDEDRETREERLGSAVSTDSGYHSDSADAKREVLFSSSHLRFLNQRLSALEPEDILRWCLLSLPNLYQTTALGLTGTCHQKSDC